MDIKVGLALGFTGHDNANTSAFSLNKGAYFRKKYILAIIYPLHYNLRPYVFDF
jgi:hypothetical protein